MRSCAGSVSPGVCRHPGECRHPGVGRGPITRRSSQGRDVRRAEGRPHPVCGSPGRSPSERMPAKGLAGTCTPSTTATGARQACCGQPTPFNGASSRRPSGRFEHRGPVSIATPSRLIATWLTDTRAAQPRGNRRAMCGMGCGSTAAQRKGERDPEAWSGAERTNRDGVSGGGLSEQRPCREFGGQSRELPAARRTDS